MVPTQGPASFTHQYYNDLEYSVKFYFMRLDLQQRQVYTDENGRRYKSCRMTA